MVGFARRCKCLTNNTKVLNLILGCRTRFSGLSGVNMKSGADADGAVGPRRQLVKDVLVFQVKLIVDGFRDLLLVPVSIGAGIMSLVQAGPKPGPQFYELLRVGRRSERWINLFAAAGPEREAESRNDSAATSRTPVPADIDELVERVESFIVDEYRTGGITGQARQRLDRALESLRARRR